MNDGSGSRSRSGTERRRKTHTVTSRFSPEEMKELDEAASEAGLTRASFVRARTLAAPVTRPTKRASIDRQLLARLLAQMARVGNNLNQIARAANVGEAHRYEAGDALAELRALAPLIHEALGRRPRTDEKPAAPHKPSRPAPDEIPWGWTDEDGVPS